MRKPVALVFLLLIGAGSVARAETGSAWLDYPGPVGSNQNVEHYLNAIKGLVQAIHPPEETEIVDACNKLLLNKHQDHTKNQSWARILVAYRFATAFQWSSCKTELTVVDPDPGTDLTWKPHVPGDPPDDTIGKYLNTISADVEAASGASEPQKDKVFQAIGKRTGMPVAGHSWDQSWARIVLARYFADNGDWDECAEELDHPEPADPP